MNSRKELFFQRMEEQELALTFDDVRLRTRRSHVAAPDVNLESRFSRNVDLKVPIVSSAMDTVTEAEMAIAMSKLGGLGVIHSGFSIEAQAKQVGRVKLHLNGLIETPITVRDNQTMAQVLEYCDRKKFEFRTFPVLDENGRMVGLLTQNDFDFCENYSNPVFGEMTPVSNVISAVGEIAVSEAYGLMRQNKKKTLPLLDRDGRVAGMYILSDVLRVERGNPDQYNLDHKGGLRVAAAVPTDPEEAIERIRAMRKYGLDVAVINTAQGDSDYAFDTLAACKETFSDIDIAIGNISEGESAEDLANNGADGILVGQGPGSICTTRRETGIGMPQVTAVYECVHGVERSGKDIPICADGGLKDPGDIPIALAARAESVMMGNMLAGTKEAPGEMILDENGRPVMQYRGMGSASALKDNAASRKRYSVEGTIGKPLAEGVESYISYKGSVVEVMDLYVKALRRSMAYYGAPNIKTLRDEILMRRITNAGLRESHPHDVKVITK